MNKGQKSQLVAELKENLLDSSFIAIVYYRGMNDKQLYDMELKHNSSLQVLYLNPLGNFDFSVTIPGFQQSNFIAFKLESDEDF